MATKFVLKKNLSNTQTAENPATEEYFFDGTIFTVGSDAGNNLILPGAAPEQMVVMREDEQLTLINSADGTRLNRQKLRREAMQPLAVGDEIRIGSYSIFVTDDVSSPAENIEKIPVPIAENRNDFNFGNDGSPLPANAETPVNFLEEPKAPRNFAEVLDTLRTEEDSFYFIVENKKDAAARIPLENAETPIGETANGEAAFVIEQITVLYAVARKDWSGIILESQRRGAVFVNGEPLETTKRLRNEDRVGFGAPNKFSLVLHEPSSLVALESLLSARADSNGSRFGALATNNGNAAVQTAVPTAKQELSSLERKYFNHFSFVEIVSMAIGTLIGAVLFFLFFEVVLS